MFACGLCGDEWQHERPCCPMCGSEEVTGGHLTGEESEMLSCIDGSAGFGRGLRSYPGRSQTDDEIDALCVSLADKGLIYQRRTGVDDSGDRYKTWTAEADRKLF